MSTPSWQDLLDEEDGPVRVEAPGAPLPPTPSAPARERAASLGAAASLVEDPALAALLSEQQALEQQIVAMGQPAAVTLPSGYALPEETPETRLAARKAERARVEARLEERHASVREQRGLEQARLAHLERRHPSRAEVRTERTWEAGRSRPRVGSAAWRMEAREPGTAAWAFDEARRQDAALEARTLPENRPATPVSTEPPVRERGAAVFLRPEVHERLRDPDAQAQTRTEAPPLRDPERARAPRPAEGRRAPEPPLRSRPRVPATPPPSCRSRALRDAPPPVRPRGRQVDAEPPVRSALDRRPRTQVSETRSRTVPEARRLAPEPAPRTHRAEPPLRTRSRGPQADPPLRRSLRDDDPDARRDRRRERRRRSLDD